MPINVNFLSSTCDQLRTQKKIFTSYDDAILYPWVEAWVPSDKISVSMGNKSARQNEAHIKSFNFGLSNGLGVKMEIVDEAGGAFFKYFQRINNSNRANKDRMMRFQWGYLSQSCDGVVTLAPPGPQANSLFDCKREAEADKKGKTSNIGVPLPSPSRHMYRSSEHTLFIQDIECQSSTGSTFKFIVNALDMMTPIQGSVDNRTFGSDDQPVPITEAIRSLFEPYNVKVDFVEIDASGTRHPLRFLPIPGSCTTRIRRVTASKLGATNGGATVEVFNTNIKNNEGREGSQEFCGPCGVWRSSNRRPLFVAREWLNTVMSKDRRGLVTFWEDSPDGAKLVVAKTNRNPCRGYNDDLILGTYIVNGGKCSPVLSFQPNFKFMFQQAMTGATRPAGGAEGTAVGVNQLQAGLNPDCAPPSVMTNLYRAGISAMQSMNPNIWQWFLQGAARWALDANIINNYANFFFNTIDAELKIQGNPAFEWPFICNGYGVSIVYVNPFRPKDAGPDYVEWMQGQPPTFALTSEVPGNIGNFGAINPILSNCNWLIMGMNHDIRDGTYHTTLKLKLLAPGVDLPPGMPLGNCPGAFNWSR